VTRKDTPWQYLFVDKAPASYSTAKAACAKADKTAVLADIRTNSEAIFVSQFSPMRSMWVGVHDKDKEGNFVYEDESSFTLDRWAKGQPNANDSPEHEACVDDCVSINGA
jgi:hypothetical protein